MRKWLIGLVAIGCCLVSTPALAQKKKAPKPPPVSLRGSAASVAWMDYQADLHDFTRLGTGGKILRFFGIQLLEEIKGNGGYRLDGGSLPSGP